MVLQYVTVNGEELPFLFSYRALKELTQSGKINETTPEMDQLEYTAWLGFKYGAIKKEKEFSLAQEALVEIFDEDPDVFLRVRELVEESKIIQGLGKKVAPKMNRAQRRSKKG